MKRNALDFALSLVFALVVLFNLWGVSVLGRALFGGGQ